MDAGPVLRAIAAGLALVAGVAAARAQSPARGASDMARRNEAVAAQLRSRLRATAANADRLKARLEVLEDSVQRERVVDSIRSGPVVAIMRSDSLPADIRQRLAAGVELAWARMREHVGPNSAFVAAHPVEATWRRDPFGWRQVTMLTMVESRGISRYLFGDPSPDEVAVAIVEMYSGIAGELGPESIRRWTRHQAIAVVRNSPRDWERVADALATSEATVARRCDLGELSQCITALELDAGSSADRLHAWYSPGDMAALSSGASSRDSATRALFRRCATTRTTAVCEAAMQHINVPTPVPTPTRAALVAFAVERGGDGAFDRLLAAKAPAAEALAQVSGIPIEQLVAEWQRRAAEAHTPRSLPSLLSTAGALAWMLLFGAVAVRRRP